MTDLHEAYESAQPHDESNIVPISLAAFKRYMRRIPVRVSEPKPQRDWSDNGPEAA